MAADNEVGGPLVSVIMPCFNAGNMLRPALTSVLNQTHANLEIIVVDNNSTDDSLMIARQMAAGHGRRFEVVTCREQGVNYARNHGYALARGDYIQWMDADDELAPDKIALQVAAMEADSGIHIAYGDWAEFRIQPGKSLWHRAHILNQVDDQVERTLAGIWYPPHLYLLRRAGADRLQAAKAWWPGRPVGTDIEYSAVAALIGLRFQHVPNARVRYNVWSTTQIGGSTPYDRRVASLSAIYRRLVGLARDRVLTDRQQRLLGQDWRRWRLKSGNAALSEVTDGRFRLTKAGGYEGLDLDRPEAASVHAMFALLQATPSLHLALRLAQGVPELEGDMFRALDIIDRLRGAGLLSRT